MEKEINNAHSVSVIEAKLPRDTRLLWAKHLNDTIDPNKMSDKFPHLLKFLLNQRRVLEYADSSIRSVTSEFGCINHLGIDNITCLIHQTNTHTTANCRNFNKQSAKTKVETLGKHNACVNCLKKGHTPAECTLTTKCDIDNCGERHHPLLHDAHKEGCIMSIMNKSSSVLLQLMNIQCVSPIVISKLTVLWDSAAKFV